MIRRDLDQILLTDQQIQQRLDGLALEIGRAFAGQELTMVAVLTGSLLFTADLLKRLTLPLRLDHVGVSSYRDGTRPASELLLTRSLRLDVAGRDVLVVDDVLDTGRTLVNIRQMITALRPRRLKFCVLLEKDVPHADRFQADFVGFHIPNQFVVGYGLDFRERYRNLTCIATLRPEVLAAAP